MIIKPQRLEFAQKMSCQHAGWLELRCPLEYLLFLQAFYLLLIYNIWAVTNYSWREFIAQKYTKPFLLKLYWHFILVFLTRHPNENGKQLKNRSMLKMNVLKLLTWELNGFKEIATVLENKTLIWNTFRKGSDPEKYTKNLESGEINRRCTGQ